MAGGDFRRLILAHGLLVGYGRFGTGNMIGDRISVCRWFLGGAEINDIAVLREFTQKLVHMPSRAVEFIGDCADSRSLDRIDAAIQQTGFHTIFGDQL